MKSLYVKLFLVSLAALSLSGCVFVDHRHGGYRGGYHHSRW